MLKRFRVNPFRQPIITGCAIPIIAVLAAFYLNMNSASSVTVSEENFGCEALLSMMQEENAITTASGLQYWVLLHGDGPSPSANSTVTVNYRGCLPDGTEFDSSYSRGQPITFALNDLILGWTEGVQLMGSGSSYIFYIPAELAYGAAGRPGTIPANSPLIFEITLLGFQ